MTREAIRDFSNCGEEFFTFEEFCTLRRATSDREKCAFFWFLGMRMVWGEHLEKCENNAARFGGTRDERIKDCKYKRRNVRFAAN
jgi:hypothetical protein